MAAPPKATTAKLAPTKRRTPNRRRLWRVFVTGCVANLSARATRELESPAMAEVFIICALGQAGGDVRKRADEVCDLVIAPVARNFDLKVTRSDRDPTPGHITTQIL